MYTVEIEWIDVGIASWEVVLLSVDILQQYLEREKFGIHDFGVLRDMRLRKGPMLSFAGLGSSTWRLMLMLMLTLMPDL